ncbi:phosphoribosyl-ATP diphosphatase [Sphingobium subterraneum]|uniref:Phosphoribosyl-ATP pyrophosphatase n=1 Tax=Sphingobium subterraneum TaxID=627688 RepID=A0A841IZ02_9SPHN|nr:phosphoribosyl-ATP diphosphatase [Sphingobium subterraneum]MBB6123893.1 phosphoribosyl-ATP pyrophosphohydrolase [Sphingobium subterraneum]
MREALEQLEATIARRRSADPETSYVARLLGKGRPKIAQKVGEEAVEIVIAAISGDKKGVVMEGADLLFHLGVLLAEMGLSFDDIGAELERRDGISGIAEKAARSKG